VIDLRCTQLHELDKLRPTEPFLLSSELAQELEARPAEIPVIYSFHPAASLHPSLQARSQVYGCSILNEAS
jgi:hypothetical protein